jgi:hypothetical protein
MEIANSKFVDGKGLFATKKYLKNEIIFKLEGKIYDYPTRETIYIGNSKHIYDEFGIYINHSFDPNVWISHENHSVVALSDIDIGDELTFNYNDNEINMANPFVVENKLVCGIQSKK